VNNSKDQLLPSPDMSCIINGGTGQLQCSAVLFSDASLVGAQPGSKSLEEFDLKATVQHVLWDSSSLIIGFFTYLIRTLRKSRLHHTLLKMKANTLIKTGALLGAAQALDCTPSAIQSVLPSGATVNFAYALDSGSQFDVPSGDLGYPTNAVGLPALCAVSVQVASIDDSSYGLGLFLPENWNGRFQAVGNGGFAGGINWLDMVCLQV
jgi:hypothetical protein